jgi:hypothetical protein
MYAGIFPTINQHNRKYDLEVECVLDKKRVILLDI